MLLLPSVALLVAGAVAGEGALLGMADAGDCTLRGGGEGALELCMGEAASVVLGTIGRVVALGEGRHLGA